MCTIDQDMLVGGDVPKHCPAESYYSRDPCFTSMKGVRVYQILVPFKKGVKTRFMYLKPHRFCCLHRISLQWSLNILEGLFFFHWLSASTWRDHGSQHNPKLQNLEKVPSSTAQTSKTPSSIRTPIHHGIFLQCKEISAVQNISIPPFLLWTSSAELVVSWADFDDFKWFSPPKCLGNSSTNSNKSWWSLNHLFETSPKRGESENVWNHHLELVYMATKKERSWQLDTNPGLGYHKLNVPNRPDGEQNNDSNTESSSICYSNSNS